MKYKDFENVISADRMSPDAFPLQMVGRSKTNLLQNYHQPFAFTPPTIDSAMVTHAH